MSWRFWTIKVVPSSVMIFSCLLSAIAFHLRFVSVRHRQLITTIALLNFSQLFKDDEQVFRVVLKRHDKWVKRCDSVLQMEPLGAQHVFVVFVSGIFVH